MDENDDVNTLTVQVKWRGSILIIRMGTENTLGDLKNEVWGCTDVLPHRQKLVGIRERDDQVTLNDIAPNHSKLLKVVLVGTPENQIIEYMNFDLQKMCPDVFDDLDLDYSRDHVNSTHGLLTNEDVQQSMMRVISNTTIQILHPLSKRKLLVLDLDYTMCDLQKGGPSLTVHKRPHTDAFLERAGRLYDIAVWSQTSWRWLEVKLTEMGLLTNSKFRINFVLDHLSMFKVASRRHRHLKPYHYVKPLQVIWTKFPQFNATNTIHIDDLSRNFALNPQSGLKISSFKNGSINGSQDCELLLLANYLERIAKLDTFEDLDHSVWKA